MFKDDRRIFDRFPVDFQAELKHPDATHRSLAQCRDVSAIGLGLLAELNYLPDTSLEIRLRLPHEPTPFRGVGKVIWVKKIEDDKWRIGLEFETVDFLAIKRIFEQFSQRK